MYARIVVLLLFASAARSTFAAPLPHHYRNPGHIDPRVFGSEGGGRYRRHATRLLRVARAAQLADDGDFAATSSAGVIDPADFGADPTGQADASDALDRAVAALAALGGGARTPNKQLDLGGAVLDLSGGVYSLSRTLRIPSGLANFRVQRGTLSARPAFNSSAYLLHIGADGACNSTSGGQTNHDCNSNVGVQQLTLDGSGRAFGGLKVEDTMDVNVGPALMVTGFSGVGISLSGSGAGYIHEAWLGQIMPGDKTPRSNATATAILLDGAQHDCDVNNVIVWSAKVGVNTTNGANRIQGVHVWNMAGSQGGSGIVLHKGAGRVQQSYLDYTPLVVSGHAAGTPGTDAQIEGNFFLGSSTIVLRAVAPQSALRGLVITGNVFNSWNSVNETFVLDESLGSFTSLLDTVIEDNEASAAVAAHKLSTRATRTAQLAPGDTNATIDFSDVLLFGEAVGIDEESIACTLHARWATALGYTRASSEGIGGSSNAVFVSLAQPVPEKVASASVTCTVDQSKRVCAAH